MTITLGITLFFAMILSAVIPGPSVLAVISRSISHGLKQGLLVTVGVLIADYVFIVLALTGLAAISSLLGELASLIKYIGITYLFWLAYITWNSDIPEGKQKVSSKHQPHATSVMTGMLITLSNPKAVLFYMGFFPAFIDLTTITGYEISSVFVISTVSVGGVLSLYAYIASRGGVLFKGRKARLRLNKLSASFFASSGVMLATRN